MTVGAAVIAGPPVLTLREWSRATPEDTPLLRKRCLTDADRRVLAGLARHTSLRVVELRQGLLVEVGPHIGTVALSGIRIDILPKLRLDRVMALVTQAFTLDDLCLLPEVGEQTPAAQGFVDLLGLALLRGVRSLVRRGLTRRYQAREESLSCPQGRIDFRRRISAPRQAALPCRFQDLNERHLLNQVLAAGLRLAADLVHSARLRDEIRGTVERCFGAQRRLTLTRSVLLAARAGLDRQTQHYATALKLIVLLAEGSRLGHYAAHGGGLLLGGFLLDMNRVFERFVTRYLQHHAPREIQVLSQDTRTGVFAYLDNPGGWRQPAIRPDLVFMRHGRPLAIGDAKYQDHSRQPPDAAELYQLVTYALAYALPAPREVMLLYPLAADRRAKPAALLFTPDGALDRVRIRLVGVPLDELLNGAAWWPLDCDPTATARPRGGAKA